MYEQRVAVIQHRVCGHLCAVTNPINRRELERQHADLAAAGQHGWRVRIAVIPDAVLLSVLEQGCSVCRIEPGRVN